MPHDIHLREARAMVGKDTNKVIKVTAVYRVRIETDENDVIDYDDKQDSNSGKQQDNKDKDKSTITKHQSAPAPAIINNEVIVWDQQVYGHTPIGNEVQYFENKEDLCLWYEPVPNKQVIYNSVLNRNTKLS